MNQQILGCTLLENTNKVGELKADVEGYYIVCLGALEFENPIGLAYSKSSFDKMTAPGSPFMRRLEKGLVYGEFGHPKQEVGMSYEQWIQRLTVIEETRVCMHIDQFWLDTKIIKHNGKYVNAIMARIKPIGPYGQFLDEMLKNGRGNVAFSIRSLIRDVIFRGRPTRHIETLIGWDFVVEPGLAVATKYHLVDTPGLESFNDFESLIAADNGIIVNSQGLTAIYNQNSGIVGLESSNDLLAELITATRRHDRYASLNSAVAPSAAW